MIDSIQIIKDSIPDTLASVQTQSPDSAHIIKNSINETFNMAEKTLGLDKIMDMGYEKIITFGTKLVLAILVLIIGLYIIKLFVKGFKRVMVKRDVDLSLQPFLKGLVSIGLKILLIISVMGMVGIEMTSFIAVLGAAGLAFGMALSGTLQNFAGGVILLIFKPFKAGDHIEAQGYSGLVKEVRIFSTIIITFDNKTVIIPNGGLSSGSLINYTSEPIRRVDMFYDISYGEDLENTKKIIRAIVEKDTRILKTPELFIGIESFSESSIKICVKAWVKTDDYWEVFYSLNKNVYLEFSEQGIRFPFPQMDVHLYNSKK